MPDPPAQLRKPVYRWFRLAFLGAFFLIAAVTSAAVDPKELEELFAPPMLYYALVGLPLFSPVISMFLIAGGSIDPFGDKQWELPTHDSYPFYTRNPLIFVHFIAYFCMANGAGLLVAGLWGGVPLLLLGMMNILIGLGMLVSMRFCIWLAGDRIVRGPRDAQRALESSHSANQ